jgi:hypothetical protein
LDLHQQKEERTLDFHQQKEEEGTLDLLIHLLVQKLF